MRTTTEVIEAARLGEPCTEEELRLCIVSMRQTMVLAHMSHARWSVDESLPSQVRLLAKNYWKSVNDYWNIPLDQRVEPHNRPGHPDVKKRKAVAEAVWDRAQEAAAVKDERK